ncbi:hypothetical protein E3N88_28057 [Mikania micrantha]|uniref:Reverse transcriptase Ty1/copia-type domain-containing protein n=1 Tax=Mikania micrantha TaxID=192012 RepID=A0A5N6MZG2_9ASTR|nr:hypothetical protein E3N88_28057 [Mikania micrantha]
MTGNMEMFAKLDKGVIGKARFGDGSCVDIKGNIKALFYELGASPEIHEKGQGIKTIIIAFYVKDLLIIGGGKEELMTLKRQMETKFKMTDLGLLYYYLGIELKQVDQRTTIQQSGYATRILEETGLKECNPTTYPMEPGLKLSKVDKSPAVDPTQFRKWVGCLRYLTHTRPDLNYSVGYRLMAEMLREKEERVAIKVDNQSTLALVKTICFMAKANTSTQDRSRSSREFVAILGVQGLLESAIKAWVVGQGRYPGLSIRDRSREFVAIHGVQGFLDSAIKALVVLNFCGAEIPLEGVIL